MLSQANRRKDRFSWSVLLWWLALATSIACLLGVVLFEFILAH